MFSLLLTVPMMAYLVYYIRFQTFVWVYTCVGAGSGGVDACKPAHTAPLYQSAAQPRQPPHETVSR